jgi:RNA polymerase sigma-70 factor (ECF subfamily)
MTTSFGEIAAVADEGGEPVPGGFEDEGVGEGLAGGFVAEILGNRCALMLYARSLAHNQYEADDLVQDTIERALRAAHRFRRGSNLRAWLTRIMRNLFLDRRRHDASVREVPLQPDAIADDDGRAYQLGPLDFVSEEDVLGALGELKVYLRQAFIIYYLDGLSYDGIAARLNILKSTVGTRLCRARIRLRRILEPRIAQAGGTAPAAMISSRRRRDGWRPSAQGFAASGLAVCGPR